MKKTWLVPVLVAVIACPITANAQGGGGRGQGGGGGRGFGGGGGQFGRRPGGVGSIPVEYLAKELKLTADQKTKIKAIQDKTREESRKLFQGMGGFGGGGGGRPGGGGGRPPSTASLEGSGTFQLIQNPPAGQRQRGGQGGGQGFGGGFGGGQANPQMMEAFQKLQALNEKANKDIEALLTADQKKKLPGLVEEVSDLRMVGIPAGALADINLSGDQKKKLRAMAAELRKSMPQGGPGGGRPGGGAPGGAPGGGGFEGLREKMQAARDKAMGVLNAKQKEIVEKARPQRGGFGGPGGPGGPGGGRPGGGRPGGGAPRPGA